MGKVTNAVELLIIDILSPSLVLGTTQLSEMDANA